MEEKQLKLDEYSLKAISSLLFNILDIIRELKKENSNKYNFDNTLSIFKDIINNSAHYFIEFYRKRQIFLNVLIENKLEEIIEKLSNEKSKEGLRIYLKYAKKINEIFCVTLTEENKQNIIKELENFVKETLEDLITYDYSSLSNNTIVSQVLDYYGYIPNSFLFKLDLSKTKAKFDLSCLLMTGIRFWERIAINCTGCDVKIKQHFNRAFYPGSSYDITMFEVNEKLFDRKTREENPKIFLSDIFTDEFKEKFYDRILNIEDILSLNEEQLNELNQNQFLKYIYRSNGKHNLFQLLIKNVDIKTIIELYTNYHDDYIYLEKILEHKKLGSYMETFLSFYIDFSENDKFTADDVMLYLRKSGFKIPINNQKLVFLQGIDAKDIKDTINNNLRVAILSYLYLTVEFYKYKLYHHDDIIRQHTRAYIKTEKGISSHIEDEELYYVSLDSARLFNELILDDLPFEFIEENKDIFLVDSNIPKQVKERYYFRCLKIQDIINYPNYFLTPFIWCFLIGKVSLLVRFICEKYALEEITKEQYFEYIKLLSEFGIEKIENYISLISKKHYYEEITEQQYFEYIKLLSEFNLKEIENYHIETFEDLINIITKKDIKHPQRNLRPNPKSNIKKII